MRVGVRVGSIVGWMVGVSVAGMVGREVVGD